MEGKLTAILSADVKGYSRLMSEDEEATIRTLTAYREVMTTLIEQHHGRVVDSPGDNLLAEFASAVDVVRCAVEAQHELKVRNAELPNHRKMGFRIGINVDFTHQIFGAEHIVWSSDYPHTDSTWPRSRDMIAEAFTGIPTGDMQKIVGGNVARLYSIN